MPLGFFGVREQAGGLDHDINAQRFPGQFGWRPGADDKHLRAIDHQDVVFGFIRTGFFGFDHAVEAALGRIVFQQIRQVVGWHDIAHGHYFNLLATGGADILTDQTLFHHGAENQPADPPESVYRNFDCHNISFSRLI